MLLLLLLLLLLVVVVLLLLLLKQYILIIIISLMMTGRAPKHRRGRRRLAGLAAGAWDLHVPSRLPQSYIRKGIRRQGNGLFFCKELLRFDSVPCRPMPLLAPSTPPAGSSAYRARSFGGAEHICKNAKPYIFRTSLSLSLSIHTYTYIYIYIHT